MIGLPAAVTLAASSCCTSGSILTFPRSREDFASVTSCSTVLYPINSVLRTYSPALSLEIFALPSWSVRAYPEGVLSPLTVSETVANGTGSSFEASTRRKLKDSPVWAKTVSGTDIKMHNNAATNNLFILSTTYVKKNSETVSVRAARQNQILDH